MTDIILFREEQRFKQWWLWLLIYGLAAIMWWSFIQQIIFGRPWGSNAGPDWLVWLFWLLFGLGLPALFHFIKLVIEVRPNQVVINYWPFVKRSIAAADIDHVQARTYNPIREYGGWGIKGWSRRRIAYNVSGNQGVELTLRDGRSVMLGSQQAEQLALAIETEIRRQKP